MSSKVQPHPELRGEDCANFTDHMIDEYFMAREKFGPFDNGHEGLAVIWEEFEELKQFVFGKDHTEEQIVNARIECVQLATMAMAFYVELLIYDN
jgi:hypothetical protein